jgi:hypothetical protein
MFGLRRFRFRSPERDRETMERRLALIQRVVRSGIAEAEAESKGLRTRLARTRRSVMSVLAQVQDRETDPACRVELTTLLNVLLSLANNKASLNCGIILRFFGNWSGAFTVSLISHACLLSGPLVRDPQGEMLLTSARDFEIFRRGLAESAKPDA